MAAFIHHLTLVGYQQCLGASRRKMTMSITVFYVYLCTHVISFIFIVSSLYLVFVYSYQYDPPHHAQLIENNHFKRKINELI